MPGNEASGPWRMAVWKIKGFCGAQSNRCVASGAHSSLPPVRGAYSSLLGALRACQEALWDFKSRRFMLMN